jgi:hypothetical protein
LGSRGQGSLHKENILVILEGRTRFQQYGRVFHAEGRTQTKALTKAVVKMRWGECGLYTQLLTSGLSLYPHPVHFRALQTTELTQFIVLKDKLDALLLLECCVL